MTEGAKDGSDADHTLNPAGRDTSKLRGCPSDGTPGKSLSVKYGPLWAKHIRVPSEPYPLLK